MLLFKKSDQLTSYLQKARNKGKSIGFVPTMGALHAGHIALVTASKKDNPLTVVSIFVNPAQFNDIKDFEKYPVTIEKDIALLVQAGCDVLFWPSAAEVYPNGYSQPSHYDIGYLETILEGKFRPGHFQGVCKVMNRLLDLVDPDKLYMGQKDYQQCMVVQRLIRLMASGTLLQTCATLREPDGLAMSSRNTRLSPAQRQHAVAISTGLAYIRDHIRPGDPRAVMEHCTSLLSAAGFRVDYVAIADAETLAPVVAWDGIQKIVALVAAFQQDIRLIDNMRLN